jgi:hypothetical protein
MTIVDDVRARVAVLLPMVLLGGCVFGTAIVSAPERLPAKTLAPLARPLQFDVCGFGADEPARKDEADRVRKALWRAGVPAELAPKAGSSVDFTVTLGGGFEFGWTANVALVTGAILPGYAVQRTALDVDLAWRDAEQVRPRQAEHLRYEARTTLVIWLPLIVVPDFILVMADGWTSPKFDDGGFRQMVARLGDDLRARMGAGAATATEDPRLAVACGR